MNTQFWLSIVAQALVVFLIIEGLKNFPGFRTFFARSGPLKIATSVVLNGIAAYIAYGRSVYLAQNWTIMLAVIVLASLATAGIHRIKWIWSHGRNPRKSES
jgi:hypothetical protein